MKGVKSLKDKQVYAVVDLETTGTDPTSDRIIQFGCVLVQEGKIIANCDRCESQSSSTKTNSKFNGD